MEPKQKKPNHRGRNGVRKAGPAQRKLGSIGSNADKYHKVDVEALVQDLANGVPRAIAAGAQGITAATVDMWLDKRPEFAEALAREKRRVIVEALEAIKSCSTKEREYRHRAWFLETVYRDYLAPPDKGFHFTQNNLMVGDLDEARRILDSAKALPYRAGHDGVHDGVAQ
jgi:hypothetical protein